MFELEIVNGYRSIIDNIQSVMKISTLNVYIFIITVYLYKLLLIECVHKVKHL